MSNNFYKNPDIFSGFLKNLKSLIFKDLATKYLMKINKDKIKQIISKIDVEQLIESFFNDKFPKSSEEDRTLTCNSINKAKKKKTVKKITDCPHTDRKHYAKNMCYACYHRQGREKKAWECQHTNMAHYAFGLCHNCYQNKHLFKKKLTLV
jgi:hypothetical protein